MFELRYALTFFFSSLACFSFAQQSNQPAPAPSPSKKGVEAAVGNAEQISLPLLGGDEEARLKNVLKQLSIAKTNYSSYSQRLSNGELKPWQDLENSKQKFNQKIREVKSLITQLNDTNIPHKVKEIEAQIFSLLQPIGPYLQDADYLSYDNKLTKSQAVELDSLIRADSGPMDIDKARIANRENPQNTLQLVSPQQCYSLSRLPTPISIKSKPGTEIYLRSGGGGVFSNGLPYCKLVVDKTGILHTYWTSQGGAAGLANILVSSPQAINRVDLDIKVVKPLLIVPPVSPQLQDSKLPHELPLAPAHK